MRRFVLLLFLMNFIFLAHGQVEELPVVMADAVVAARPGMEILIAITAEILEGWSIQAHEPSLPYLIPTSLSFEPVPGIIFGDVIYPEPVWKQVAFAKERLLVYTGYVIFLVPVKIAEDAEPSLKVLHGKLFYQPCTDTYCRFPEELEISLLLLIVR